MPIFSPPNILNSARWKNMRIGLLGGSFNPPHIGHVHISKIALMTLNLDAVWWLVTPQNPLKSAHDLLPLEERVLLSRKLIDHPKIIVSDLETQLGTQYTYDTVRKIKQHFKSTQFCWITGMDNAHSLHYWQHWQKLLKEICMVHITRQPPVKLIKQCPTRMLSCQKHVVLDRGEHAPLDSHTTYWVLQKKMVNISSTEIRMKNKLNSMT